MANNIPAQYIHERPELDTIVGTESIPLSTGQAASKRTTINKIKDFVLAGISLIHNDLDGLNAGEYQHLTVAEKAAALAVPNHNDTLNLNTGDYLHFTAAEKANFRASKVTTVGTGGDYATISAAVTANKTNLILISNVTEIAGIIVSTYFSLDLSGFTLNMSTYNFTFTNNINRFIANGTINFAYSVSTSLFEPFNLYVYNVTINNNSTVIRSIISSGGYFDKCTFNLPNLANCGLGSNSNNFTGSVINCTINGGGSSCTYAISTNGNYTAIISGITCIGSFGTLLMYGGIITNVIYNAVGTPELIGNSLHGIFDMTVGRLTVRPSSSLTNFRVSTVNTFGSSLFANISNGEFITSTTIVNSYINISNVSFTSGVIISGDNITLTACKIGSVNAGAKTITIQATADKTILVGNRTEAAISDSGTNTSSNNNLLF